MASFTSSNILDDNLSVYIFDKAQQVSNAVKDLDVSIEKKTEVANLLSKRNDLKTKLVAELNEQVTDEFYINYNDDSFRFEKITQESIEGSDNVKLKMRGRIC